MRIYQHDVALWLNMSPTQLSQYLNGARDLDIGRIHAYSLITGIPAIYWLPLKDRAKVKAMLFDIYEQRVKGSRLYKEVTAELQHLQKERGLYYDD